MATHANRKSFRTLTNYLHKKDFVFEKTSNSSFFEAVLYPWGTFAWVTWEGGRFCRQIGWWKPDDESLKMDNKKKNRKNNSKEKTSLSNLCIISVPMRWPCNPDLSNKKYRKKSFLFHRKFCSKFSNNIVSCKIYSRRLANLILQFCWKRRLWRRND